MAKPIGVRIKQLREQAGMSVRQLAEKSGVTAARIYQLEAGDTNTTLATLRKLAQALGVSAWEIER